MLFVSMSNEANGAENVLAMLAEVSNSQIVFLKKVKVRGLDLRQPSKVSFVTEKSMLAGFGGFINFIKPYRNDYIIVSTHAYLNAYLGVLKRIGFIKSTLVVRECTSIFLSNSGIKRWSYWLSYALAYPAVDMVICQTAGMREQLLANLPFLSLQKVVVLNNPLEYDRAITLSKSDPRDSLISQDYICAAGRLIPEKGFSLLIVAFSKVMKIYPHLKLLILGEGPEREFLERLIKIYGLHNHVILKGWVSNPFPYFKMAKACVLSSLNEGFPNVLLQMMVVNPVVVATVCADGINDIPGIYKAEVNDANALAEALKLALANNGNRKNMSVNSYVENRAPEAYIDSILQHLYQRNSESSN